MNLSDRYLTSDIALQSGERLDDLQFGGLHIIQKENTFHFGTDAVLLSDFAIVRKRWRVADLGTGTGVIALLIAAHHVDATVDAIEIQEEMADMAYRSTELNGLQSRVSVHHLDMRDAPKALGYNRFDAVVCNPPYSKTGAALLPENENKRISRIETEISIQEICETACKMLKSGGRLSVVFPAQRALEMMNAMQNAHLTPKRVRCVQATVNHAPRLILIDAVKQGGEQLDWLPPLILNELDGTPSAEWKRIYSVNEKNTQSV